MRKLSRFNIEATFLNKSTDETFLVLKIVSCINDIDPFNLKQLDWTDFETTVKVFGPINMRSLNLPLYDEFKIFGEGLSENFCISGDYYFGCLMQECNKLYDKEELHVVKAKRYEINFNLCDLFEKNSTVSKVQTFSLNEFLSYEETISGKYIYIDLRHLQDNNFLFIYSKQGFTPDDDTNSIKHYEYDYSRNRFNRDIKAKKGALIYDPRTNKVVKQFIDIFAKETNVENLLFSNSYYVLDNLWNLYNISTGQLLYKIKTSPMVNLNYKYARFILNGRYFLTTSEDDKMIYIIRCYDCYIAASLRVDDYITCLNVGDSDRIVLAGTKTGHIISTKFLIDLEFNDAIKNHIGFCRNITIKNETPRKEMRKVSVNSEYTKKSKEFFKENLNNDLKRVIHSAHAHRELRSKESLISASSFLGQNSSANIFNKAADDFHIGVAKTNLTRITSGIKNSPISTRACIIQ